MERYPEKWDRYKFLTETGHDHAAMAAQIINGNITGFVPPLDDEEPTYATGIIVDVEIIEGQHSLQVLMENSAEDPVWQQDNPFGLKHLWDYEAWEFVGKTSLEEMLLSDNELIRDFAVKHREELEALGPSNQELSDYQKSQELKQRIAEADDDELDKIIDGL